MEKKPKLNLEPPNFSKAKLPLGDDAKVSSAPLTPKLPLGSEPMGLAAKLSLDLEKAYENPAIKAYLQAEEDRKALISASIEKWNEPSLQNTIREYQKLLKSPTFSMALEKSEEFDKYKSLFSSSLASNNLETAKKALEGIYPHLKSEYSVTQSALEQIQKTLASPSIQSSLSHLENFEAYESGLAKAAASIAKNEDLLGSAKLLAKLGTSIASDSLEYKIAEQSRTIPEIFKRDYIPLEIPKSPVVEQNAQIITILEILKEQNDTLITVNSELLQLQTSDSDIQNNIILLMQNQQTNNEIIINELKTQSERIEDQLSELKTQNTIASSQISDNRKSSRNTMIVAIFSILLSAYASYKSYQASYEIYHLEKTDNDADNVKLLDTIEDKQIEMQKQDRLIKLMEEQNTYLKKLAERESK